MKGHFILFAAAVISLLSLPGLAIAMEMTALSVTPEVWLNSGAPQIDISFACSNYSSVSNVYADIAGPGGYSAHIGNETFIRGNPFRVRYSLGTAPEGQYRITAFCSSNESSASGQVTFWVNRFNATLSKVSFSPASASAASLFPGDKIILSVMARNLGMAFEPVTSNIDFKAYLGDSEISISKISPPLNAASPWTIEIEMPSSLIGADGAALKLIAANNGHEAAVYSLETLSIKNPLEVNLLSEEESLQLIDSSEINLTVQVFYRGSSDIDSKNIKFGAKFDGGSREIISSKNTENNLWVIEISIPKKDPSKKSYPLEIIATYENITQHSESSLPVWFVIPFKGQILDSSNNPVQARLRIGEDKIIDTSSRGEYDTKITPGEYDIELTLGDLSDIIYNNADLEGTDSFKYSKSPIKYDSFDGSSVDATRIVALEFGYPFASAEIALPYDQYGLDKDKVTIYQCSDWNFVKRECSSTWKAVNNFRIDNYAVRFSAASFFRSAFAIGEKKSIYLELDKDSKKEYFIEEGVSLKGIVKDNKNTPLSGAKAGLVIRNTGNPIYVNTNENGEFEFRFYAPKSEGTYSAEFKAEKDYLSSVPVSWSFEVSKKKELTLTFPSYVDLDFGKSLNITGSIKNTGQVKIEDISIGISNPPFSGIEIEPKTVASLDVGEEKEISISMTLYQKDCNNCNPQYSLDVSAKGEDFESSSSFILNIRDLEEKEASSQETQANTSEPKSQLSEGILGITGFVASGSNAISGKISESFQNANSTSLILDMVLVALILVLAYKIASKRRNSGVYEPPLWDRSQFVERPQDNRHWDKPPSGGKSSTDKPAEKIGVMPAERDDPVRSLNELKKEILKTSQKRG